MRFKFLVSTVLAFGLASGADAGLINGDFEDGLNGWEAYDDVSENGGVAIIGDNTAYGASTLFQASNTGAGVVNFEFDFFAGISDDVTSGHFSDIFVSSLYFTNDLATFDLFGGYEGVQWMFDVDAYGEIVYDGTITDSAVGTGWRHFSFEFVSSYDYVVAVFDIFEINGNIDSTFQIDNVSLSAVIASVPEPSSMVLFLSLLGFAGLVRVRALNTK
ncbi:PEP-CTERM sorting domain-containing protein [Saccharophagus degradans]|uniref:PEP-CTERM sorting domain-containing protein n=1 Tax=Saccharophagus degradans TaxID=86304 RepID=UPI001C0820DA|nr:PEP-CTERM sorting domain-containing protein [Saccharophagus degradans]MBU2985705.1 PEP-CTERM sorting domain-containing protein [Saccharophagus degradans]